MKNLVLVAAFFISLSAFGQEMPVIKITGNDVKKEYKILFSSTEEQKVVISLIDQNGREVVRENVNARGFVKTFDINKVTAGTYTWKLAFGRRTFTEEFDVLTAGSTSR